jgi:hypothetical protein
MFKPTIKPMVTACQENIKILASTPNVMVIIEDDMASNMALNDNTLLTKRGKIIKSGKMSLK